MKITAGAIVALGAACTPAMAQTSTADADDTIVVTGTRERSRTQFDTLAPVDVLSADGVRSSVSGDMSDTLA
ncbi:hypothetical protein LZK98_05265 [Sphingomonas cannabina]|uniref:hypothetical protein n=1 Tax=Sphingomonas cannabina TaxID=2899123 RepID=UPI001F24EAE8|nr:hypothetical protein [Sphingomonas cannabina]UIJ46355.1 hypothetical protein LZK98_05265 [Sphingomonas cannabina]